MVDIVIAFWGIAIPVMIIAGGIWLFIKLFSSKKTGASDDEARIVQECFERLGQMEQRINTLETLLMDAAGPPPAPAAPTGPGEQSPEPAGTIVGNG